jgi:hypothetical protein
MKYILFLFTFNTASPSISTAEFDSKSACETASLGAVIAAAEVWPQAKLGWRCIPKGDPPIR